MFIWTPPSEGLVVHRLLDDELVVALPKEHVLAKKAAISLSELSEETFIIYGRRDGCGLFAATIAACRATGFSPRFGPEAPRLASALSLAAAVLAYSLFRVRFSAYGWTALHTVPSRVRIDQNRP